MMNDEYGIFQLEAFSILLGRECFCTRAPGVVSMPGAFLGKWAEKGLSNNDLDHLL
jgi:hypothetical protein